MAQTKWSRRKGWAALAVAAVCAAALLFLVGSTALETGKGAWTAAFLFAIGLIAAASALLASHDAPVTARHWSAWLQPRPLSFLFLAIFAALGTMTNALTLFEPRPAVESAPGEIEKGVKRILTEIGPKSAPPSRIRVKLPGVWGEPGCAVTYRFQIRDQALTVDALRTPRGAGPFRLVGTITGEKGDEIYVTGEQPDTAKGQAAIFTYVTNGVVERLTWDDQAGAVPLELDRCA